MDAQQPLPTTPVTTEMALKAIVRVAKALQKEAKVTAGFKANLPAICDNPKCQICDPSVRRSRFRSQEGGGAGSATIDFKDKIDKLGQRYPEFYKMFFTRVRWEKWYENSEERIDVRHFVMGKNALEWAMMFLGHGEFTEQKTRRRGHDDSASSLRNRSRWILKLRGAIASMLRNWEVIGCQLGRTIRKRQARRRERERRRIEREEKIKLRDEVEKTAGWMHLNANMPEPREDEEAMAELNEFDNKMAELDWLEQYATLQAHKAQAVQADAKPAEEKEESRRKRILSDKEGPDDVEMPVLKRMAELSEFDQKMAELDALRGVADDEAREAQAEEVEAVKKEESGRKRSLSDREGQDEVEMPPPKRASRRELSLSDRQFFVEESGESDDEDEVMLDAGWDVEGGEY